MSNRPMRRALAIAALTALSGCGSALLSKQATADLATADALVLKGCYECLKEARDLYAKVAVGKARPLVIQQLFETQVLLTLREKELALDAAASLAAARQTARELPPEVPSERLLTLVEAVPSDAGGWPRSESEAFRRAHIQLVPEISDDLVWLQSVPMREPVRRYVGLALDCGYPTRPRPRPASGAPVAPVAPGAPAAVLWPRDVPPDAPPLVVYRFAICRELLTPLLERVRADVGNFVETTIFLGRLAKAREAARGAPAPKASADKPPRAKDLLAEAYAAFPRSPAVTNLLGSLNQTAGDCRTALKYYDETLALKPVHEDALLGRTMCLTFLRRLDEGIEAATRMIDLKTDNAAYGFYWRGYIRHQRRQLDLARADLNEAKSRDYVAEFFTLAGIVEYESDVLDIARQDLLKAKTMTSTVGSGVRAEVLSNNCVAMWYLGLVAIKQEAWIESGNQFNDAMACYERSVTTDEKGLTDVKAQEDLDPDYRAQQIANFEASIKDDRSQQYASAFNAANQYAHGGNLEKARALLAIAALDPALAERVQQLRDIIK